MGQYRFTQGVSIEYFHDSRSPTNANHSIVRSTYLGNYSTIYRCGTEKHTSWGIIATYKLEFTSSALVHSDGIFL